MALFASSNDDPDAAPSIGAHPAFPAIAALWFATMLGLGTLLLPSELIERSGLPALVSAPFGLTAQASAAIAAALTGALAGYLLARLVGGASQASEDEPVCRPLQAREELEDLFDGNEEAPAPPPPARELLAPGEAPECLPLADLVRQLGAAMERHPARNVAVVPVRRYPQAIAPPAEAVTLDTDTALRVALARLQELRGAV